MVSVIIPAYRAERFLPDIIGDVFRQSYADWELIVVSNGAGQEAQLAVLERLKGEAPAGHRVEILSESQGNVSHARNVGMAAAKGEWLAFVDADDRIAPSYLQALADATKSGEPEIVIGGHTDRWINKRSYSETKPCEKEAMLSKRQLLEKGRYFTVTVWGKLFSKALIENNQLSFNVNYQIAEDGVFVKQCLLVAQRIKAIPACGYEYRHANASSAVFLYNKEVGGGKSLADDLYAQLMQQAGYSKQLIAETKNRNRYNAIIFAVYQLFLSGCPLSFREKCREVRRLVFDDAEMPALMSSAGHRSADKFHRLFDSLYRLHSPVLMVLILEARQLLANTYHKFLTLRLHK